MNEPLVLSVGDLVVYKQVHGARTSWDDGELHIIREVHASESGITYATHRGAWFRRTNFDLVEACNEILLDILFTFIVAECDGETEDDYADGAFTPLEWREPEPKAIRRSKYDI